MRVFVFLATVVCLMPPTAYTSGLHHNLGHNSLVRDIYYNLSKDSNRTSRFIKTGLVSLQLLSDDEVGEAYREVNFNVTLEAIFHGTQNCTLRIPFPKEYFEPGYLAFLRESKDVVTSNFHLEHLGFKTIKIESGLSCEQCDLLKLSNINSLQEEGSCSNIIDDMELKILVVDEDDAIGAVQLDIMGSHAGFPLKLGFDLFVGSENPLKVQIF